VCKFIKKTIILIDISVNLSTNFRGLIAVAEKPENSVYVV